MGDQKRFVDEFMEVTNIYRKRHQVDKLVLNNDISKIAQAWADKLTTMNTIVHNKNPTYKGESLGENIASRFSSEQLYYSGHRAVGQWYQEIEQYNFTKAGRTGLSAGHFTQLVWKGSREVGVGRAQNDEGMWIVVANYYPAGNIVGRFETNVLPSIDGNTSIVTSPNDPTPNQGKQENTKESHMRIRKAMKPHSEKIETTRKITKVGKEYFVEETVTTTKTDGDGKTNVSVKTVTRPPTKEEIEKINQ